MVIAVLATLPVFLLFAIFAEIGEPRVWIERTEIETEMRKLRLPSLAPAALS